tara:strand:+ start:59 stop:568 length:510 start_codon:yes stop_codon:yes gene_type:complete
MKKLFAALVLLGSSFPAQAGEKIAVININEAILNTDFAKAKIDSFEADPEFKKYIDEVNKIQEKGIELTEKYKKNEMTMSAAEKSGLESKIKIKQADLEHVIKTIQQIKAKLIKELQVEMQNKAMTALQEVVETEGIGLLLKSDPEIVIKADTSFDISAKVTEKLNKMK